MFSLYKLSSTHHWDIDCYNENIQAIYDRIERINKTGYKGHYRIDCDERQFAFVDTSEFQLGYMKENYDTNEKCKTRYERYYNNSKVKTKRK